jgi:EAL domain-containing protein (putative c-di-GMP-specific phosphodiesterase class I)
MTLPKTIPLVEKKKDRPMGLQYRPMFADAEGHVEGYEASAWFGGIAGRPGETEEAAELEAMLVRKNLLADVSFYFLYEAADALVRAENCKLKVNTILVDMMPEFYHLGTQLQRFNQLFKDQPVSRDHLLLTIPEETILNATKSTLEIIERYLRNGLRLVLDGYDPGKHGQKLSANQLKGMGFVYLRLAPELYMKQETANTIQILQQDGFTILGSGADNHEILNWLVSCGVAYSSGTITGVTVNENELIRDCLIRER